MFNDKTVIIAFKFFLTKINSTIRKGSFSRAEIAISDILNMKNFKKFNKI